MTSWRDIEQAEPEFAQRVRALFDAHRHKTLATLRADGAPHPGYFCKKRALIPSVAGRAGGAAAGRRCNP